MANSRGTARTNYFHIKDEAAFRAEFEGIPVEIIQDDEGRFGLISAEPDTGLWPTFHIQEGEDEEIELDFPVMIADHLAPGEVAILMEAGSEKARYVFGAAIAINDKGETRAVNLNSIYDLAKELTERPGGISPCEY